MKNKRFVYLVIAGAIFAAITGGVVAAQSGDNSAKTRLEKAVAMGKITQAEADEKLASLQGKYHKVKGKWAGKKMAGEKLQVLLDKSVAAGKMTQAEADEKLEKFQANPNGKRGMK